MKIEVNIEKNMHLLFLLFIIVIVGIAGVIAYNSGGPPDVIGHSLEELEGVQADVTPNSCGSGQAIYSIADDGSMTCRSVGSLQETTVTNTGNPSAIAQCPSGWIRTGCSGGNTGALQNVVVSPVGNDRCEARSGASEDVRVYAYCVRLN